MTEQEGILNFHIQYLEGLLTRIADMVYDEDTSNDEKIKQISYILDEHF